MTLLDAIITFTVIFGLPIVIFIGAAANGRSGPSTMYLGVLSGAGLATALERVLQTGSLLGFYRFF